MTSDELNEKLIAAGACSTSAGVIVVDVPRFVVSFIEALKEIERLNNETMRRNRAEANS